MKASLSLFAIFFLVHFNMLSQLIRGKVTNEISKKPVPFAVIAAGESNRGVTCDIDGNFELALNGEQILIVQVTGYEKKIVQLNGIDQNSPLLIKLKPSSVNLLEITVTAKESPANAIIKKVIQNKPKYDIEKLKFYSCKTYAKTYFALCDKSGDENFYLKDSAKYKKAKKWLDRSYIFFVESVTEKKFIYPNTLQEKVLSSRVSGFKSAPFGAFATQLQSFTFYKDNIELMGVKYLSPLISGTFKRYRFEINDTVITGTDTTLLIKFFPRSNAKFRGMKGILYINKNQYVLSNVLAEPSEIDKNSTAIKVQQLYEKIDSAHWFPKQANTELIFNSMKPGDEKEQNLVVKGVSKVYISEVNIDSAIKIKNKNIIALNETGFDKRDDSFWNKYRTDSLNKKELNTYKVVDSLSRKNKIEEKVKWYSALISGKFPLGYFDLDLKYLLRANEYEGFRPGAGFSTSNKVSRWWTLGAYTGYGFTDKAWKYGANLKLYGNSKQTSYLMAEAASDVYETAGTFFYGDNASFFSTQKVRDLLISKMDRVNFAKGSVNVSLPNGIKTCAYLMVQQRTSPYGFLPDPINFSKPEMRKFTQNEIGFQLRYWPGEKYIETMNQLVTAGSKWPVFYLNIAKGIQNQIDVYKGDFDYTKIDLRIDHQINFRVKGFIAYQLQAGKVFGNVPYSWQYNNKGSRSDNYYVSAEKSFETMYVNEFISTEYAAFFFALNFGKLVKPNKFMNPELELVHNYGIGNLNNRQSLTWIELNDISKGYTEAGFRIKNLYRSNFSTFGLAVFYRYGNYAYDSFEKNLTYKLAFGYAF
jgi:hypothetical protein